MNIGSILESMLFISGEPMSFKKLSKHTSIEAADLENSAKDLAKKYNEEKRGLRILIKDGEVQMVTAGENSKYVENFMKEDIEGELSRASLEVLSVVAYRGPIPRSKIEEIRGVNCSFTLRHLLIRGLIERVDNPSDARAYLYRISFDFLKKLGVEKAEDLPRFEELRNKKILEERFVENAEAKEEAAHPRKEFAESEQKRENTNETGGESDQGSAEHPKAERNGEAAESNAANQGANAAKNQTNNDSQ